MRFLEMAREAGGLAHGAPIRMEAWKAGEPAGSEAEPEPEQAVDVPLVYSDLARPSTGDREARVCLNFSPLGIGVPSACWEMVMGPWPSGLFTELRFTPWPVCGRKMQLPFRIEPQVRGGAEVGLQVFVWTRRESLINNNARTTSVFSCETYIPPCHSLASQRARPPRPGWDACVQGETIVNRILACGPPAAKNDNP